MADAQAKVVHYTDVPAQTFGDSAPGTSIRWLIDDEHDGAPVYALRMIEIEPGEITPQHSHPYEHENFVVEGKGRLMIAGQWRRSESRRRGLCAIGTAPVCERRRCHLSDFCTLIPVKKLRE